MCCLLVVLRLNDKTSPLSTTNPGRARTATIPDHKWTCLAWPRPRRPGHRADVVADSGRWGGRVVVSHLPSAGPSARKPRNESCLASSSEFEVTRDAVMLSHQTEVCTSVWVLPRLHGYFSDIWGVPIVQS